MEPGSVVGWIDKPEQLADVSGKSMFVTTSPTLALIAVPLVIVQPLAQEM